MATRSGIWVGWPVLLTTAFLPSALAFDANKPPSEGRVHAENVLADVDRAVDRLTSAGRGEHARTLADEAARLRRGLDGALDLAASTAPELHVVAIGAGARLPEPDSAAEEPQFAPRGYAEVRLRVVGRPIVLALSSRESIHWRITADERVQLLAVVIAGEGTAKISGVPEGTLVLDAALDDAARYWTTRFTHQSHGNLFDRFEARLFDTTGLGIETMLGAERYDGRPVVVGAENAAWRVQVAAAAAERLRRRALAIERDPPASDNRKSVV
jgi:hypothetical protein